MKARFDGEEEVDVEQVLFLSEDGKGGEWAEYFQGRRERQNWWNGEPSGIERHVTVKTEQRGGGTEPFPP